MEVVNVSGLKNNPSEALHRAYRDVFARLHASDFRISAAVIQTVLRQVGQ